MTDNKRFIFPVTGHVIFWKLNLRKLLVRKNFSIVPSSTSLVRYWQNYRLTRTPLVARFTLFWKCKRRKIARVVRPWIWCLQRPWLILSDSFSPWQDTWCNNQASQGRIWKTSSCHLDFRCTLKAPPPLPLQANAKWTLSFLSGIFPGLLDAIVTEQP